jgi:hypothetical protein
MMLEILIIYILSHWLRLVFANMVEIDILLRNMLSCCLSGLLLCWLVNYWLVGLLSYRLISYSLTL